MKVLLLSSLPPPEGGISTWTRSFIEKSSDFGLEIGLVNMSFLNKRQIKNTNGRNLFEEVKRSYWIFTQFKKQLKNEKYEIIHLNTSCSVPGMLRDLLILKLFRKLPPLIIHYHCNVRDRIKSKFSRYLLKKLSKQAKANIAINIDSEAFLKALDIKNVIKLANFLQINTSCSQKKDFSGPLKTIVFVGHIEPQKGVLTIMNVAKLKPEYNFKLIGKIPDGFLVDDISKNVDFLGVLPNREVYEHLILSDVFLFPTHSEGFSISLLEAMFVGLPVITTKVGASEEVFEDKGALYTQVNSVEDIINCLTQMNDPILRKQDRKSVV